jgi:hypothetical protein
MQKLHFVILVQVYFCVPVIILVCILSKLMIVTFYLSQKTIVTFYNEGLIN